MPRPSRCIGHGICAGAALALVACVPTDPGRTGGPIYEGIDTRLLDDDLVNIVARLRNGTDEQAAAYARCGAAQYALIRGFGFARHVRTSVVDMGGLRVADAVYTISPALPEGARTLDAEVIVADCAAQGIPTI